MANTVLNRCLVVGRLSGRFFVQLGHTRGLEASDDSLAKRELVDAGETERVCRRPNGDDEDVVFELEPAGLNNSFARDEPSLRRDFDTARLVEREPILHGANGFDDASKFDRPDRRSREERG